jgi:acetoacetyl-CoA reductase
MNKITLISGATKGIGKIIANRLLIENHKIINISKTGIIPDEFKNKNFISYKCDISNIKNTFLLTSEIVKKYKIDNVILNSGITEDKLFHKMNIDEWTNVLNTNLLSIYGILNPIINQMRYNNKGNIIFISSVNAHRGVIGQTNYSSSKSGIIAFNRCLVLENSSKNIKCNVISPGYIETKMIQNIPEDIREKIKKEIPMKRFGKPEEITNIVKLLLSDDNYFQGANIDINGGLFIR